MTKPTKEEVLQAKREYERVLASVHTSIGEVPEDFLLRLMNAYLLQEEELERLREIEKERIQWCTENTLFRRRMNDAEDANHKLKAQLAGTFTYGKPKRGEPLPYHIEEEPLP